MFGLNQLEYPNGCDVVFVFGDFTARPEFQVRGDDEIGRWYSRRDYFSGFCKEAILSFWYASSASRIQLDIGRPTVR